MSAVGGARLGSAGGSPNGRALLGLGLLAGPFYLLVSVAEIAFRTGFDYRRHAWSLLSNGELGWVHVANFVVTGLLVVGFAIGVRARLTGAASKAGPILLGIYGVSLVAAGVFVADPALGFPPGTPEGPPVRMTGSGMMHFVAGAIGFFALIAACLVFARRFQRQGETGWAGFSLLTGLGFLATFIGVASGTGGVAINLAFTAGVVLTWLWIVALAGKLRNAAPAG